MKKISRAILLVIMLLILAPNKKLKAQNEAELGMIPLTVKLDINADELTKSVYSSLESRLLSILSNEGFSSLGKESFYCVPSIIIESSDKAEGGMKTVFSVKGLLNIKIIDGNGKMVLDNVSMPIAGYATSQQKAVNSSVSSLDFVEFKTRLPQIRDKIKKYFKDNKIRIMGEAKKLAANEQYEEAIASLMVFPESVVPEYKEILELAEEIYRKIPGVQEEEDSFSNSDAVNNSERKSKKEAAHKPANKSARKPANKSAQRNKPTQVTSSAKTKVFNPSVLKKVAFNFINSQNNTKSR